MLVLLSLIMNFNFVQIQVSLHWLNLKDSHGPSDSLCQLVVSMTSLGETYDRISYPRPLASPGILFFIETRIKVMLAI